jgi:hypothetical protein
MFKKPCLAYLPYLPIFAMTVHVCFKLLDDEVRVAGGGRHPLAIKLISGNSNSNSNSNDSNSKTSKDGDKNRNSDIEADGLSQEEGKDKNEHKQPSVDMLCRLAGLYLLDQQFTR